MHNQLSLTGKLATEPEAGATTKSGADVKLPQGIEQPQTLSPGLAFLIRAVARMAQEVRPPIWLDPPPPAPPGKRKHPKTETSAEAPTEEEI